MALFSGCIHSYKPLAGFVHRLQVEPQGVFSCLIFAFDRGWDGAKLLHQTHAIHQAPMFHELAISNTDDVDHAKGYALAGGRDAQKLALLGAAPGHADYHLVAFGEDVINCGFEIWEGAAQHDGQHFYALAVIRYAGWELFVVNEVGRRYFANDTDVSPVEELLD